MSRPRNLRPTRSGLRTDRSIGRAAFFSLVLRIWGSDPALGPLPAHSQSRQSSPDGLASYLLLREALFEAHLGGEIQRPHTRVFAELPGFVVQKLPQSLGSVRDPGRPCERYADV